MYAFCSSSRHSAIVPTAILEINMYCRGFSTATSACIRVTDYSQRVASDTSTDHVSYFLHCYTSNKKCSNQVPTCCDSNTVPRVYTTLVWPHLPILPLLCFSLCITNGSIDLCFVVTQKLIKLDCIALQHLLTVLQCILPTMHHNISKSSQLYGL